jgi:hypothetical protein
MFRHTQAALAVAFAVGGGAPRPHAQTPAPEKIK